MFPLWHDEIQLNYPINKQNFSLTQRLEMLFYTASIFSGVSQPPKYHLVTNYVQWPCLPHSSTTLSQSSVSKWNFSSVSDFILKLHPKPCQREFVNATSKGPSESYFCHVCLFVCVCIAHSTSFRNNPLSLQGPPLNKKITPEPK